MAEKYMCRACGAELPPSGQCVPCLLRQGLGEPESAGSGPVRTSTVFVPPTEKRGDRIGRYKLLEQIGEGGFGIVYIAEQEEPVRRRVALKVIKLGMDTPRFVARFEAERQALALMEHPNVAQVFDGGVTQTGRPFFVMELIRGVRITDYCDQHDLPTCERLGLFIQVCQAIQHAHQKGIIHRDIKPSNILVADYDGVPVPKVIDFGIVKAVAGQTLTDKTLYTSFEQFIGTPAYMSPEQAGLNGLDIDTRSDIYSLGVLLYELLTGKTPFDAKRLVEAGLDEIRRIIREEDPPRPSTRISTLAAPDQTTLAKRHQSAPHKLIRLVRRDLDWIVMKALEKNRRRRYETANGLAMDVRRYLDHEPVLAAPPSWSYSLLKSARGYLRRISDLDLILFLGICAIPVVIVALCILELLLVLTCDPRPHYERFPLTAVFSNVQKLKVGDPVKICGVEVGYVEKLVPGPSNSKVEVWMRLRGDVGVKIDSVASIKSNGWRGHNFVAVKVGSTNAPYAPFGTRLATEERLPSPP